MCGWVPVGAGSFVPTEAGEISGMTDAKQDILDMLRDLAKLTLLDEGDRSRFVCARTRVRRRPSRANRSDSRN